MSNQINPDDSSEKLDLTIVTNSIRSLDPHTTFMTDPSKYIAAEVEAVKPALLYGDNISLRSYLVDVATMASGYDVRLRMPLHRLMTPLNFAHDASPEILQVYGIDAKSIPKTELKAFLKKWKKVRLESSVDDLADFYDNHYKVFNEVGRALFDAAKKFHASTNLTPFNSAVKSGLLRISGWSDIPPEVFESEQEYINRAGWFIEDRMLDPTQNFVLDAGAVASLSQAKEKTHELTLASSILRPLPAFAKASIDEILDIRNELARPLTRFRSEIASMASSLPETGIDDQHISYLWRTKLQPAIDEIDELTEENKYLRQLADKAMEAKTVLPATATFTLGIAGLSGIAQACAAAAGIASIPLEAARSKKKQSKELQRKHFYFLWKMLRQ